MKILIRVSSNSCLTVVSVLDTSDGPKLIYNDISPPSWKEYAISFQSPQPPTENGEVVNVECILTLFIRIDELRIRIRFVIVKKLAVNVLHGESLVNQSLQGIFLTKLIGPLAFKTHGDYFGEVVDNFWYTTILEYSPRDRNRLMTLNAKNTIYVPL